MINGFLLASMTSDGWLSCPILDVTWKSGFIFCFEGGFISSLRLIFFVFEDSKQIIWAFVYSSLLIVIVSGNCLIAKEVSVTDELNEIVISIAEIIQYIRIFFFHMNAPLIIY